MGTSTTTAWLTIVGLTTLGMVTPVVVLRLPATKRWFRKLDARPLAALNGFALVVGTMALWPLYLAVIAVVALAVASHGADRWELLSKVAALLLCSCLVLRVFFAELERITTFEMEDRRFQQLLQGHRSAQKQEVGSCDRHL